MGDVEDALEVGLLEDEGVSAQVRGDVERPVVAELKSDTGDGQKAGKNGCTTESCPKVSCESAVQQQELVMSETMAPVAAGLPEAM